MQGAEALALDCDINADQFSAIVAGEHEPTITQLVKFARCACVPLEWLVDKSQCFSTYRDGRDPDLAQHSGIAKQLKVSREAAGLNTY